MTRGERNCNPVYVRKDDEDDYMFITDYKGYGKKYKHRNHDQLVKFINHRIKNYVSNAGSDISKLLVILEALETMGLNDSLPDFKYFEDADSLRNYYKTLRPTA